MISHILHIYRKYRSLIRLFKYDAVRYLNNSMILNSYKTQGRLLGLIVARQHVVEKGLTMPSPRMGFGKENIFVLIDLCKIYEQTYDNTHEQFLSVVSVLKEYLDFHEKAKFQLDNDIQQAIHSFIDKYPSIIVHPQKHTTKTEFFESTRASFDIFARSRHTVRNYSNEEITDEEIRHVIDLAQTAPSACNRQPVRVHVCGSELAKNVLKFHNGNRGFGDRANKVLVVTADLSSYIDDKERNCPYVDGGIFVMNLLYALHFYKIGACTLNWSADIERDKNMRNLLSLPNKEEIICLLTIGKLPEALDIANSERIKKERVLTFHK